VELKYDLDGGPEFIGTARLIRMHSSAQLARDIAAKWNGTVYGATMPGPPPRMYLMWDTLRGDGLFIHVAMHELLHGFGADHVFEPGSVLYWRTSPKYQSVVLTAADKAAVK
jgi:hypothetical protein